MLCYDTGQYHLWVRNRCGSNSLKEMFRVPPFHVRNYYGSLSQVNNMWKTGSSIPVTVIRHPVERIKSALKLYEKVIKPMFLSRDPNLGPIEYSTIREENYKIDCVYGGLGKPFFREIMDVQFHFIPFEKLGEYCPFYKGVQTHTKLESFEDCYEENKFFTREQLREEIDLYNFIISNHKIVDSENFLNHWKEKVR